MRNMKRVIRGFLIAALAGIFVLGLAACDLTRSSAVETPQNLEIDKEEKLLTWEEVENATGYIVDIDGTIYEVATNSFDLSFLAEGTYTVKIKAVGAATSSGWSQAVEYTIVKSEAVNPQKLDTPQNLQIDGTTLTWTAVFNAAAYKVDIDGTLYSVNTSAFLLSDLTIPGQYYIKIKAIGGGTNFIESDWSNVKIYTVSDPSKETRTGDSVIMEGWTYGDTANVPDIEFGSGGETELRYMYQGINISYSSSICPENAGTYELIVTFLSNATHNSAEVIKEFTILKADGVVSVIITGWEQGKTANNPIPTITKGDYASPKYSYEGTGGTSYSSSTRPVNAGTYKLTATFAATTNFNEAIATYNFTISGPVTYTLTVTAGAGGSVSSNGGQYTQGAAVSLTATVNSGSIFDGWYNGEIRVSTNAVYSFSMPANSLTLEARFIVLDSDYTEGLLFTLINGGTEYQVSVGTAADNGATEIVIPAVYNGLLVTKIANEGFRAVNNDATFTSAINITSVFIPTTVKSIGQYAFFGCGALKSVNIPSGITVLEEAVFAGCMKLENIEIPYGVTTIGASALYMLTSVTEISLPSSVTSVGQLAFAGCIVLERINLSPNMTTIPIGAFYLCMALESLEIPAKVTSIGSQAFIGCESLINITVANGNTTFKADANCLIRISNNSLILGCKTSVIPNYVTSIGAAAFATSNIISVEIPASVTDIGTGAFELCSLLESVVFHSDDTKIGQYAFNYCSSLKNIILPANLTSISAYAFAKTGLTNIEIPLGVSSIGSNAFDGCSDLKSVTLPGGLKSIGEKAFYDCTSLTSIIIPSSVTSIGFWAFFVWGSTSWDPASPLIIYAEATSKPSGWDSDWNRYFPVVWGYAVAVEVDGVQYAIKNNNAILIRYIGNETFLEIPKQITINGDVYNVTGIGDYAFYNCKLLTNISIPTSITSIGISAFSRCSNLKSVILTQAITTMGENAFAYCTNLTIFSDKASRGAWPSSFNSYGDGTFSSTGRPVFWNCVFSSDNSYIVSFARNSVSLSYPYDAGSVNMPKREGYVLLGWTTAEGGTTAEYSLSAALNNYSYNIYYAVWGLIVETTIDGAQYAIKADNNAVLIKYIGNASSFRIPNQITVGSITYNITDIGEKAFLNCTFLTGVEIPTSITSIGADAFSGCSGLKAVILTQAITSMGENAFAYCTNLTIFSDKANRGTWPSSFNSYGDGYYSSSARPVFWNCVFSPDNSYIVSFVRGSVSLPYPYDVSRVNLPEREDKYLLLGWTTVEGGTTAEYLTLASVLNSGSYSATYYAVWQEVTIRTYTFVTNGGTPISDITAYYLLQSDMITTKNGWVLEWYDNADFIGTPITQFPYFCLDGTKTVLYAKWFKDGKSFNTAYITQLGEVNSVKTTSSGQRVYFEFTPDETKNYTITFAGDTFWAEIKIYDSNLNVVRTLSGNSSVSLTAGETYYFEAYFRMSTGTYTFRIA